MSVTKVIAIVGPTASGKTGLAVALARALDGEVINADSMQIYRELSVSTAKPTAQEMSGVVHHLLDIKSVTESFSVVEYVSLARAVIADITNRGKIPIICGGTGLYVDSLLSGVDYDAQPEDPEIREKYRELYESDPDECYRLLCECDPEAAKIIHKNNGKRVVRALEVYFASGQKYEQRAAASKQKATEYEPLYIFLTARDREYLYSKIDARVDDMINRGLIDEARAYYEYDISDTSSQAIGCKEMRPYLTGDAPLDECVDNLKRATRRYAKRQITWFSKNRAANVIYIDDEPPVNTAAALCKDFLKEGQ